MSGRADGDCKKPAVHADATGFCAVVPESGP